MSGRWRSWGDRSPDNEDRPGLPPKLMANCLATGPPGRGPEGGSHEAQARQEGDEVPGDPPGPEGSPESRVEGGLAIRIPLQTRDRLRAAAGWGRQQEFVYAAIMTAIEAAEKK